MANSYRKYQTILTYTKRMTNHTLLVTVVRKALVQTNKYAHLRTVEPPEAFTGCLLLLHYYNKSGPVHIFITLQALA